MESYNKNDFYRCDMMSLCDLIIQHNITIT